MGKLRSTIEFTGTVGGMIAYKRRGIDDTIVQSKGGPTAQQVKSSPAYALVRRHNMEFGGRATMSKWIMRALWPLKRIGNYNIAGPLNKQVKLLRDQDLSSELGKRNLQLSIMPQVLEGFQLNNKTSLESMMRTSFFFSLSRAERTAKVVIQELIPGVNFVVPGEYPFYSIVIALGVVPDLFYTTDKYRPVHDTYAQLPIKTDETAWMLSTKKCASTLLEVKFDVPLPSEACTLMLSIGIRLGIVGPDGLPEQVPYVGAAKVLMLV